jgi:Rieske Fe-S protein
MERGEFIKVCAFSCLGGSALISMLEGCGGSNYFAQFSLTNNQIILRKSEFQKVEKSNSKAEPARNVQRKYVLLNAESLKFPISVYMLSEDKYSALWLQCTHKGCEVKPNDQYLVCPCHGSEFTRAGDVQLGPAALPLKTFVTKTDHENIYIQL